ncbi:MAG: Ig-like domain-containing protein [Candidatus Nanopelagicales bacterium]
MRAGRRILAVAAAALVVTLVPALPAHAAAAVSITSPSNNANIWNASSSIAVSGDTGDPGDPADRIEVLANGNLFDTVTCGGTDQACTGSVPWNATGAARSTVFTAVLYGTLDTGTALDTSSAVTVNVVPPDPSITWSGLSNGQVGGAVKTISATGSTVSGDVRQPQTLQLVVDGVVVDSANCSANPCTTSSLTWDTPEVSGASYNVRVRLVLDDATTWPGDLVTVTTAAPTASVTQPANGANVTGTVTVGFSVATNANIGDVPDTVRLLIDGNATGTAFTCPGGTTHTCTGTFSWAPDNGSYAVSVRMTTVLGTQVVSTARTVNVNNLPSISITAPAAGATVIGLTDFSVTASTAGRADRPSRIDLFLGSISGQNLVDSLTCSGLTTGCSGTLQWDATGSSGNRTLIARITTSTSATATDSITVSANTPAPQVSLDPISSPVKGKIQVTVNADTSATLTEYPATVRLFRQGDAASIGAVNCPASQNSCTAVFNFDATTLADGNYNLYGEVVTTASRTAQSGNVAITVANPLPRVVFSPSTGTITGKKTFTVTGTTDAALTDFPKTLELSINGTVVATATCPGDVSSCTRDLVWDSTYSNVTSAVVRAFVTTNNGKRDSAGPITMAVSNSRPRVTITSPSNGAIITTSPTRIAVTAYTSLSQSDRPRLLRLYVDGALRDSHTCPVSQAVATCKTTLVWSSKSSIGPKSIRVRVYTSKPGAPNTYLRFTDTGRTYYGYTTTVSTMATPAIVKSGGQVTLKGKVTSVKTGFGIPGVTVRVVRDPAIGATVTTTVKTDSQGLWRLVIRPGSNSKITATALVRKTPSARTWMVGSVVTKRAKVLAPLSCSIDDTTLVKGKQGTGTCFVPGLPVGTTLALRYVYQGQLFTLATGKSRGERIPLTFTFTRAGTYQLRISLAANTAYEATRSDYYTVVVS